MLQRQPQNSFGKKRQSKRTQSIYKNEHERKQQLFSNSNIFAASSSVTASTRKIKQLNQSVETLQENKLSGVQYPALPQLNRQLVSHGKSNSIKFKQNPEHDMIRSSVSPSFKISTADVSVSVTNKFASNRFANTQKKHLDSLHQNGGKHLSTNPSMPNFNNSSDTKLHSNAGSPYKDSQSKHTMSRNLGTMRSNSDERLEEWSQVFRNQHNRWQDEFDDLKARFLTDFEMQKLKQQRIALPQPKPATNFQIPNEYLSLERRTVKNGNAGTEERLRRDKIRAKRDMRRKSTEGMESSQLKDLDRNASVMTIQNRAASRLDLGQPKQFQSQRDDGGDSSVDEQTRSLNNSTSIGKILYTKDERTAQSRVRLPSIYKKNLKKLHKNIQLLKTPIQLSSQNNKYITQTAASSILSTQRIAENDLTDSRELYRSSDQIQTNKNEDYGGGQDSALIQIREGNNSLGHIQNHQSSAQTIDEAMRIQQNISSLNQSPRAIGKEIQKLFKSNPDSNPFRILYERNKFDAVEAVHQRKVEINRLTHDTKVTDSDFQEGMLALKQRLQNQSMGNLAGRVNVNINMTINQYNGDSHQASAPNLIDTGNNVRKSEAALEYGRTNQDNGSVDSSRNSIEDLKTEKRRLNNKIRISRRQMLEPLKVASKLGALSEIKSQPKRPFVEDIERETFLTQQEKMGEQLLQLTDVRKFVDKHIEDDLKKMNIKKSLQILSETLEKQGMTLREVVDQHTADLLAKANKTKVKLNTKLGVSGEKGRVRFTNKSNGFDFVRILECSSSLQPLIGFQRKLKERSKRRHQKWMAAEEVKRLEQGDSIEEDLVGEDGLVEQMAHLKKKRPEFIDQDQSIAYFLENLKKLIFLGDQQTANAGKRPTEDARQASAYNWVDEPEMYQSSSGESKYSNEDKDQKDHFAIGEEALMNTMRKYKNADKIIQKNQIMGQDDKTSHLVKYMDEMNKNGHVPKGFGFVHRKRSVNAIDAGEVQLSDQHARAIANSLDRAKYVNKLILRNVGLTDSQGIAIIRSMDKQIVRHLDVSYNPLLTKKFYTELNECMSDPACNLERLEVEGNKIGDRQIHEMVQAMIQSKNIVYLNVSRNRIEDAGARDIALLIQECPKLRLLFMHYNRVLGFGGVEIADAVGQSKSLQVLDVSFNSMCGTGLKKKKEEMTEEEEKKKEEEKKNANSKKKKPKKTVGVQFGEGTKPAAKGFADLFARGFSENWAEAFAANKSLLHVDMSHNHLDKLDVEIIAGGLKDNQQILGFHFAGNSGDVDNQGFVKPGEPLSISHASILTRIQDQMQAGIVKDSRALKLKKVSNCWICEGWSEQHFTYTPGKSDDNPNHDEFKPIKLHLDIDHFEGDLMTTEADEKVYEIYRMLPPGSHRYFYSVDGKVSVAKDQNQTSKKEKKEKKLFLDMSKLVIPKADSQINTPKDSKKQTPKGMRAKEAAPVEEPLPDYYELDLPVVNYIEKIAQNRTPFTPQQIERMNCVPRPGPKGLGNRNKVRTPWDFTLSVFASYKIDSTRLLNDCFEADWARTKVNRIVKNEEERERFKTYLRSIYKWFREVYKFYSGSDPMNDIFCIGTNVFSDLINGLKQFVDGKYLKLSDLDLERIQTNANEQNSKYNPKNNLVRHNFLEVFMRMCETKYMKNGAGGPEVDSITKAFKVMFDTELFPYFRQFDSQHWRKTVLWQEDVDYTLKIALDPLKSIYRKFIGRNSLPGGQQYMSLTEFTEVITNSECLSDNFGGKQIGNQFNQSMMTQVDEIDKDRHLSMTFVEFLEAIVRVAEKTEIPHCLIDEFNWGVDEIDPDMRDSYAKRDLVTKLEALIFFLMRGNLPQSHFAKYQKLLEEYKGAGLYANDLDTGSFSLNQKKS